MHNCFNKRSNNFLEGFGKRQNARKCLPLWLRIFAPFIFLGITFLTAFFVVFLADKIHHIVHPELSSLFSPHQELGWVPVLILFPSFLLGGTFSLLLSNGLCWLIKPIRKIMDENARGVPNASFSHAMSFARKALLFVGFPAFLLTLLGALAPWDQ